MLLLSILEQAVQWRHCIVLPGAAAQNTLLYGGTKGKQYYGMVIQNGTLLLNEGTN